MSIKSDNFKANIFKVMGREIKVLLKNSIVNELLVKSAWTYCIINEAAPSGVVTMDHFSSLKVITNAPSYPQHYLA